MKKALMARIQRGVGRCLRILLVLIGFPVLLHATEAQSEVAILYPQVREPYLKIFLDIAEGVEKRFSGRTRRYELAGDYDVRELETKIEEEGTKAIVALGNRSYSAVKKFSGNYQVLLGAVTTISDPGFGGIKMVPSADAVFENLSLLAPSVKKIHVVYESDGDTEIIERAHALAALKNVTLHAYASNSIREAAAAYRQILDQDAGPETAIWLVPGSTTLDNAILTDVLGVAWRKKIVVFSSRPSHVKRGVLFAVYPDNLRMGYSLGELATQAVSGGGVQVRPLMDVRLAVNQRTSEHLGLTINNQLRKQIDLLFSTN